MELSTIRELRRRLLEKHPELASRFERAVVVLVTRRIAQQGNAYLVEGSKAGDFYKVTWQKGEKSCECVDYGSGRAPGGFCKHIIAVCMMMKSEEMEAQAQHKAQREHQ